MSPANDPSTSEESTSASSAQSERAGDDRQQRIREAAYCRAEARGFAPGGELDDWIAAEREANDARGTSSIG
jgi:hypothetical protein